MADKSEAVHSHTHKSLLSLKAFAKISTGALMGIYSFIVDGLDFPRSAFQITSEMQISKSHLKEKMMVAAAVTLTRNDHFTTF